MIISKESFHEWKAGSGTATTDPAKLSSISFHVAKHVVVKAHEDNDGDLILGPNAGDTANGYVLSGGETSAPIPSDDVSKIWVVASATTQDFSWFAV